jgi:hypothetical protein
MALRDNTQNNRRLICWNAVLSDPHLRIRILLAEKGAENLTLFELSTKNRRGDQMITSRHTR